MIDKLVAIFLFIITLLFIDLTNCSNEIIRIVVEFLNIVFKTNYNYIETVNQWYKYYCFSISMMIIIWLFLCLVTIIFSIYVYFKLKYADKQSKQNITGNFNKAVYKYLNNTTNHCFLITGQWGIGKTYALNSFFEKYYNFSKTKIYRISCFGLYNRELLLNEVKSTLEEQDKSIYHTLTQQLPNIPLIGDFLHSILKKDYSLNNIPKGAIFIFDDFERIAMRLRESRYLNEFGSIDLTTVDNRDTTEAINEIVKNQVYIKNQDMYQRYNAAVGLINELNETKQVKVIVLCNSDIMGNDFINEIFRGKLSCTTYHKKNAEINFKEVVKMVLEENVFEDENYNRVIEKTLNDCADDLDGIWIEYGNYNLRYIKSFVQSYIDTVVEYNLAAVKKENFHESVLYSILVTYILDLEKQIEVVRKFIEGSNLSFMLTSYIGLKSKLPAMLKKITLDKSIYWVGNDIACYAILTLEKVYDLDYIFSNIDYHLSEFSDIENQLISHKDIDDETNIGIEIDDYTELQDIHLAYLFLLWKQDKLYNDWWKFIFENNYLEVVSTNGKEAAEEYQCIIECITNLCTIHNIKISFEENSFATDLKNYIMRMYG